MQDLVEHLSIALVERGWKAVTAESCTGGLVSAAITHRPRSSAVFERGFVTYSNEAKMAMLGVTKDTLSAHGAVSEQSAIEMALGAIQNSLADVSVSITGIAGPDGGTEEKPTGLVYIGYAVKGDSSGTIRHIFDGNREQVRAESARAALKTLISLAEGRLS